MKHLILVFLFFSLAVSVPLGDYLWCDTNLNGLQDQSELGLSGIIVELTNANGTVLANTTTDFNGMYLFNVSIGTYVVRINLDQNADLIVQPTLYNKGLNNRVNSKAVRVLVNGTNHAAAEITVNENTTEVRNIDFGFDCYSCHLTTYLFDSVKVAGLGNKRNAKNVWHYTGRHNDVPVVNDDHNDHSFSNLVDAGAILEASVTEHGRMACIHLAPVPGVTVGKVEFFSLGSTFSSLNSSLNISIASADGANILSQVSVQTYSSGDACVGRTNCQSFPMSTTNVYPQVSGDIEFCIGCSGEFNPAPIQICFTGVRTQQLAAHTVKAHVSSVIGANKIELDLIGILPLQCDYLSRHKWNDDDWNNNDDHWDDEEPFWNDDHSDKDNWENDDKADRKKKNSHWNDDDNDYNTKNWKKNNNKENDDDDSSEDDTEVVVVVRN